jgi:Xaa-Pro aminopeptidase
MKARKNEAELAGTRAAHLRDGAAVVRYLAWLAREAPKGGLTEIDAVAALEAERLKTGLLKDVSFTTIAGAGPNAALPHYRVTDASNRRIEPGIFLVDSGGQYEDGTTDITRTLAVGEPTAEMRDRYTRVLKGHLAISRAVFPRARPARSSTRWRGCRSGRPGSISTTAPAMASAAISRCTRGRSGSPSSARHRSSPA